MRRKVLGMVGVLLFGSFAASSGAFAAPFPEPDSEPLEMCVDESALTDDYSVEPAALKVFCLKPEYGAPCSNRCIAAGLGCAPMHTHPYKSGVGWGLLFSCNTLAFGHMCGFQFANGDACYVPSGPLPPYCVYTGGQ